MVPRPTQGLCLNLTVSSFSADFSSRTAVRSAFPQNCKTAAGMSRRRFCNLWRCGELNPGPNPIGEMSLRRIADVMCSTGCEEHRRNHSRQSPCLGNAGGRPRTDFVENSARSFRHENRKGRRRASEGEVTLEPSRRRTRCRPPYRSKETSPRVQQNCWHV